MSLPDHFDMDALNLLRDIMGEEFPDLIKVYVSDSARRLNALATALAAGDAVHVRELAHSFKGASSNISALPLAALLQQLEDAGREQQLHSGNLLLDQIRKEFLAVSAHLQSIIL